MWTLIRQVSLTILASAAAAPAAIIRADDVQIIGQESGGVAVTGTLDVFVELDDPMTASGFQIQLTLPSQVKVYFDSVDAPLDHPAILPAEPFTTLIDPPSMLGTPPAVRTIKATFLPVEIEDGDGLARIHFRVEPDSFGFYPVTIVTLGQDPFFGTAMTDEDFAAVPVASVNGIIRVVPEPASLSLLWLLLLPRRR